MTLYAGSSSANFLFAYNGEESGDLQAAFKGSLLCEKLGLVSNNRVESGSHGPSALVDSHVQTDDAEALAVDALDVLPQGLDGHKRPHSQARLYQEPDTVQLHANTQQTLVAQSDRRGSKPQQTTWQDMQKCFQAKQRCCTDTRGASG